MLSLWSSQTGVAQLRCPTFLLYLLVHQVSQHQAHRLALSWGGQSYNKRISLKGLNSHSHRRCTDPMLICLIKPFHTASIKLFSTYQNSSFLWYNYIYVQVIFITTDETTLNQVWQFGGMVFPLYHPDIFLHSQIIYSSSSLPHLGTIMAFLFT